VNRSVSMDRIKYVGFDMDHTLVGESHTVAGSIEVTGVVPSLIPRPPFLEAVGDLD